MKRKFAVNDGKEDIAYGTGVDVLKQVHDKTGVSMETLYKRGYTLRAIDTGANAGKLVQTGIWCSCKRGRRHVTAGFVLIDGLFAATRVQLPDGKEDARKRAGWIITHIPSGNSACGGRSTRCRTLAVALAYARELAALDVDWESKLPNFEGAKDKIRALLDSYVDYSAPEIRT